MPKVGLKDTLTLLAKGYSKKEIDALAAADEEQDKDPEPTPTPAPVPDDKKDPDPTPAPEPDKKDPDPTPAPEPDKKDPEPDYKKMYEDLKKENDETKEKLTKLQQKNVHADSTPDSDKQKEEQAKSLTDLVRGFM